MKTLLTAVLVSFLAVAPAAFAKDCGCSKGKGAKCSCEAECDCKSCKMSDGKSCKKEDKDHKDHVEEKK
jgi:hypothetical protein